jgi:hypothetical protein
MAQAWERIMKKKFDNWVRSWSDGTLLLYFTALYILNTVVIIVALR